MKSDRRNSAWISGATAENPAGLLYSYDFGDDPIGDRHYASVLTNLDLGSPTSTAVTAYRTRPINSEDTDTTAVRPWLTVHSERFVASFTVVMGSTRYQQRSVLQKEGRTFRIIQRRYGLYRVADESR